MRSSSSAAAAQQQRDTDERTAPVPFNGIHAGHLFEALLRNDELLGERVAIRGRN